MGKLPPEIFRSIILPHLGASDEKVLVGPQHGVDVGIVEIGDKAVALTADPVFIVPEYGWERAAWFAVHILASDAATSGLRPCFMAIDLNLPVEMTLEQLEVVWRTVHKECERLGIAIVAGHTAKYENCGYPMVGGAVVLSVGDKDKYVTPSMAEVGDKIIITKGPAIEASGIFAAMFPDLLEEEFGPDFSRKAQELFYRMTVVEDAMTAVSVGVREDGVTAMHDATECGVWGALHELAQASGLGLRVEKESIVVDERAERICSYFGIDPYSSISEGTLIISCRPHKAEAVVDALRKEGIPSSVVGELVDPKYGIVVVEEGEERELEHPKIDPFWEAFYEALRRSSSD
ncbi:MAG TPA: AIR synthase [Candidatus Latescibacteria bacterium]|nr:AIR synthase [Candidatus Latescibacterota bacterium]